MIKNISNYKFKFIRENISWDSNYICAIKVLRSAIRLIKFPQSEMDTEILYIEPFNKWNII
jgi:hypothetical protein